MKGDQAHREEEEGEAVLEHQSVDRTMHAAIGSTKCQARPQHRAKCTAAQEEEISALVLSGMQASISRARCM